MDAESTLETFAEIAISMTGFAGIVGALAGEKLRPAHPEVWFPFWAMISSGLGALFAALFPFLPHYLGAPDHVSWAASSALVAMLTACNVAFFMPRIWRAQRRGVFARLPAISVPLDVSSAFTIVSQVLNALGVGLSQSAGGFLVGLYSLTLISGLNFVFLLYVLALPRRGTPDACTLLPAGHPVKIFANASKPSAEYHDWDPRYPEVVRSLLSDLGPLRAGVDIEHVGSTAIPGCGGKGVIDLMALYPDGSLEETKTWLLALGLSQQGPEFARAWPESRPMVLGSYRYLGKPFMVYVHVLRRDSDEVRRFRDFRDLLRGRADLVTEYCRLKRQIVSAGATDTDDYAVRKRPFMREALGASHALRDDEA